jgi:serine/threonine protein kinase
MKVVHLSASTNTGFTAEFDNLTSFMIDDKPFAEGGFGRIYHCREVNSHKVSSQQVIKIFKDNNQGSAAHSFKTITGLQQKIMMKKRELECFSVDFLHEYPAFFGAPQFVFEGTLEGEVVRGYSANNLKHYGYVCFSDIINNADLHDRYFEVPIELIYSKAYHLSRAFRLLNEFSYIHADFKTNNFFVSLDANGLCALIDFDSGAIIEKLEDDTYTWGTPQDMLAPEIYEQLTKDLLVKVNLFSDMWSVAIANHYLIYCAHPLFFLKDVCRNSVSEYAKNFSWPQIDKSSLIFNNEHDEFYSWYLEMIGELPMDLFNCFRGTVINGYFNPELRTSYSQWSIKLQAIIPDAEKRLSLSQIRRKTEPKPVPNLPKPVITSGEFPGYISNLMENLIYKRTFLYEHRNTLNTISKEIAIIGLLEKVEKFLAVYYEVTSDGNITEIEKSKIRFQGKTLSINPDTIEKILRKSI